MVVVPKPELWDKAYGRVTEAIRHTVLDSPLPNRPRPWRELYHIVITIEPTQVRRSGTLEMDMPTVAIVGQYQFVIRTREFDFEPPHVHVRVGNEDWARILLDNGEYSHEPPPGHYRSILEAFDAHAAAIREEWFRIHAR